MSNETILFQCRRLIFLLHLKVLATIYLIYWILQNSFLTKKKMHKSIDLYWKDLVLKYLVVIYAPYKLP